MKKELVFTAYDWKWFWGMLRAFGFVVLWFVSSLLLRRSDPQMPGIGLAVKIGMWVIILGIVLMLATTSYVYWYRKTDSALNDEK